MRDCAFCGSYLPTLLLCFSLLLINVESSAQNNALASVEPVSSETIYSGPQFDEILPEFTFRVVLGKDSGTNQDIVAKNKEKPILMVFVHDVNRQSISFTRVLTKYALTRASDNLTGAVIFLDSDPSNGEAMIKRIQHALTPSIVTGVSLDGIEGPGSYGLNRNVTLTILIAKDQRVTNNFALVQPSLQSDLPKVLKAIVSLIGGTVPSLQEIEGRQDFDKENMAHGEKVGTTPNLRPLLSPLIKKDATDEQVEAAARIIETRAAEDSSIHREITRIAKTIVNSGKLPDYGTAKAQSFLTKWAMQSGD